MFRASGHPDDVLEAMAAPYRDWQHVSLHDGNYFGFIAEVDAEPVGGVGQRITGWPPHPLHPDRALRGYVLNLFVEPGWRGRGVGRALMAAAEAEFRRRGVDYAILHATRQGRPLYERDGWDQASEVGKLLTL